MQFPTQSKPPVGVIFDTTMGRSIDEALALALLHGLEGKSEARIASVSVINPDLQAAAFCDVIGRFYASSGEMSPSGFVHVLPVGLSTDPKVPAAPGNVPMLAAALPAAPSKNDIRNLNDTAEPVALIRNALTAQYDDNAVVILAGPATNLVKVMDLPGAPELFAHKARLLCWVTSEFNLKTDLAAAKRVAAEWPTRIVTVSPGMGDALPYPGASIAKDFAWSPAHPIAKAYEAYKPMPYDAPAPDMAAVLYAIRPQENYFKLSAPGTISIAGDGGLTWTPSADGRHQSLVLDPAQKERVLKAYTELASAKPVPRKPRAKPEQKKDEAKPVEAKPPADAKPLDKTP